MTWKAKNVCFTINNPTYQLFNSLKTLPGGINYTCWQVEQGTNGTKHIQGYAEAGTQKTLNQWKQWLSLGAHLESRRGTQSEAISYCKKDDTCVRWDNTTTEPIVGRFEIGTPFKKKNEGLEQDLKDPTISLTDLKDEYPIEYMKHHTGMEKMKEQQRTDTDRPNPTILIYYGKTGAGKSFYARTTFPDAYKVVWPTGGRWWWPNYDHQQVVILDEFRMQISFNTLIQLLDAGKFTVEYKGGNKCMTSTTFVFTTNTHPKDWYPGVTDRTPLFRRLIQFGTCYEFKRDDPTGTTPPTITEFHLDRGLMTAPDWDFGFTHTEVNRRGLPERSTGNYQVSDGGDLMDLEKDPDPTDMNDDY